MKVGMMQLIQRLATNSTGAIFTSPALYWDTPMEVVSESCGPTEHGTPAAAAKPGNGPVFLLIQKMLNSSNAMIDVTLGRADSNDIVIEHPSISRFHAYFVLNERTATWTVRDADSTFGTFIDDKKLEGTEKGTLADNCRVKVGEVQLTFMLPPTADAMVRDMWEKAKVRNRTPIL